MKKIIPLIVSLVAISISIAISQTPTDRPDNRNDNDSDSLTFEVNLNKREYLPFEPIKVHFKVSNKSGVELDVPPPDILRNTGLAVIDPAGEKKVLSVSVSSGGGANFPGAPLTIRPFEVFEAETILPLDPGIFEKTGAYRLQFSLNGIESNAVKIAVRQPSGVDKDAFEFLKQHGKDPNFGSVFLERNGADHLEKFVREFSGSVYGDFAGSALGRYYLYNGEPEKAKAEFEKIKNSGVKLLSERSKKDIAEAERKLAQKTPE
jgi:hypothetical protein